MKNVKLYKLKIKDYKTNYVRYREIHLQKDEYLNMLNKLYKVDSKGFELLEIYPIVD